MLSKIRNYIFTGLLVIIPVAVSIAITIWLFKIITNDIFNFLPASVKGVLLWQIIARLIIVIVFLILLAIIGFVVKMVFIQEIFLFIEKLLIKIPLFNKIYSVLRETIQAFRGTNKSIFAGVVIVEFFRKDVYSLGFITSKVKGEIARAMKNEAISVFIPTSPNPTAGFTTYVNPSSVIELDISIEDGMNLIISCGIITPP